MLTTLLAGRSEVRIPEKGQKIILFSKKRPDGLWSPSGAHPASHSIGTGKLSRGQSGRGVKLATQFLVVPRLRMCGTIPLLPPPQCLHDVDRKKTYKLFYYLWSFGEKLDKDFVHVKLIGNNHKN